ncbi:MAG: hypothetical protein IPI37_10425 [Bacteroidales bacterium]|nr:hypothetical protein [Bacteroidales bacterium]
MLIRKLCDRHFGIGETGVILIEECEGYDFRMSYFNSDGSPGEMWGNGASMGDTLPARHITGFAILPSWRATDPHTAVPAGDGRQEVSIRDVSGIRHTP